MIRARRRARSRTREQYDVVFYTPFIGSILSSKRSLPPGGAETQILLLSQGLVRAGLRVAIIVYGSPAELPEQVAGVRIIPRATYRLGHKRLVGKAIEAFRIVQSLWRAPSSTVVYRCASLELGLVGLYAKFARRRLVFSTASLMDFDFGQVARKRRDVALYHLGVRLADAIVVQTDEQVELCEKAFDRRPIVIPSLSPVRGPRTTEPEAFLWVGRLIWYKDPLAYIALAKALPEATFWMVGVPSSDPRAGGLADQVASAAKGIPNLKLLDPRPHAEIGALMDRAVASVNTAVFEGMPNVLLEAWSRGVPALVLHHDPGGVITRHAVGEFAAGSSEQFVELARSLWDDRSDRAELSRRCIAYVEEHHAPDAVAERWARALSGEWSVEEAVRPRSEAAALP